MKLVTPQLFLGVKILQSHPKNSAEQGRPDGIRILLTLTWLCLIIVSDEADVTVT